MTEETATGGPLPQITDRLTWQAREFWEDSPEGWPRRWGSRGGQFRLDGRPTAQWSRIKDGRNDDLGAASGGHAGQHCH